LYTGQWVLRKCGYFNPKVDNESGKNASLVGFEPTTSAMLKFYPDTGKPMTHHDDAVKVAPDIYKVLLENDAVRVLEIRMKQGAKSETHSHPRSVAIVLNDQRIKFSFPNGKSDVVDLKRGQAIWFDALSHSAENAGTEDATGVLVELKK
jgi:quercetin dioxygenase-like cupin family protein